MSPEKQSPVETKPRKKKAPRLGRGLSSLMAAPAAIAASSPDISMMPADHQVGNEARAKIDGAMGTSEDLPTLSYIAIDLITPNPHQPRQDFDAEALETLANSIQAEGVMQPILVRPAPANPPTATLAVTGTTDGCYEIIAGERRWRAAKAAGLEKLPVIVRHLDEQQLAEWSLVENLQRQDLNPIERAQAFNQLIERFELSHQDIAKRIGLNRSTVSNLLRLLDLCDDVQALIRSNHLSAGHAKAIAGLSDPTHQMEVARRVFAKNLSVRQTELVVRRLLNPPTASKTASGATPGDRHLDDLQDRIGESLKTKVTIRRGRKKGAGTLAIDFYSLDQFDSLMQRLGISVDE